MASNDGNEENGLFHCPICPFFNNNFYVLALHIEESHFAEESSFVAVGSRESRHAASTSLSSCSPESDGHYLPCPEDGCGEEVEWSELQEHLDLHLAEHLELEDDITVASDMLDFPCACPYCISYLQKTAFLQVQQSDVEYLLHISGALCFANAPSTFERSPGSRPLAGGLHISRRCVTNDSNSQAQTAPEPYKRLSRQELGPYAFEDRMPLWLYKQLSAGGRTDTNNKIGADGRLYREVSVENEVCGLVPLMSTLLEADPSVKSVHVCHPAVRHVFRTAREGGFCGYRNIQMMISFVLATRPPGHEAFSERGRIPSVIRLQEMIETAWDRGFNAHARIETGGIKGTRKYIGTTEVEALFNSLSIPTTSTAFHHIFDDSHAPRIQSQAYESLLQHVQDYFARDTIYSPSPTAPASTHRLANSDSKVHCTWLPPIFLQHPGHSLTIIGIETHHDRSRNLLVLDPGFKPSAAISKLLSSTSPRPSTPWDSPRRANSSSRSSASESMRSAGRRAPRRGEVDVKGAQAARLLDAYRRGRSRLARYGEFEVLSLSLSGKGG